MRSGFSKGLLFGSIIGATIGIAMEGDGMRKRKSKIMKNGKRFVRASSEMLDDFTGIFR